MIRILNILFPSLAGQALEFFGNDEGKWFQIMMECISTDMLKVAYCSETFLDNYETNFKQIQSLYETN